MINLKSIDTSSLEIYSCPYNIRKDLHVFVDYVGNHIVKRTTRENSLPKVDAKRLAKIISDPDALELIESDGWEKTWLNYIDELVLKCDFVDYGTEGKYRGYHSRVAWFAENYIQYDAKQYNNFLAMSLQKQEQYLVDILIGDYSYDKNEFFRSGIITGKLDTFNGVGCGTGVLPHLNFKKARNFLFEILKNCECNVWYSTASLIKYLKAEHPYFLIPEKPKYKYEQDRKNGRYGNFHEGDRYSDNFVEISEKDHDAFERVEGRYIERFLEGIPLMLGYVTVAYAAENKKLKPSINRLQAFKLSDNFFRYMQKKISEPRVVVQPNFEIYIESGIYPANILKTLKPLTDNISDDTITILKLKKKKIAARMAIDDSLDIIRLLEKISAKKLPANVVTELKLWAGHSEMFVLYNGFGLLESDKNIILTNSFDVETIAPSLKIVRSPDDLFSALEKKQFVPINVEHSTESFSPLPVTVKTVFKGPSRKKVKKNKSYSLKRKTSITLYFPDNSLMEQCRDALRRLRCPIETNPTEKTISYQDKHGPLITKALKELKKKYKIKIEDIG